MHLLMTGAALLLMAVWLFLLPMRLADDLRRVVRKPVGSSGAPDAQLDQTE